MRHLSSCTQRREQWWRWTIDFELIRSFVVVAQKLSFVEAADDLQLDPSALSRRIRRLEKRLGKVF